ncbi:uncharacterized protein LOC141683749 [Apium graveolens]|uniref:uncharacterized protein LOC141683749 n=1 Tax=Apium graveolens TaxID=4045 RepID=UPI003D79828A
MWRSILAAQDIIKQGIRRKIGDGEQTSVWHIPWLPGDNNGFVSTEMPRELEHIRVINLMETGNKRWDEEVLRDIFNESDVQLIKSIPIPNQSREDSWFWNWEKSGTFSVKSCYRALQGNEDVVHVLFDCPFARLVWSNIGISEVTRINRWVWDKISVSEFGVRSNAMNMLYEWRQRCAEVKTHVLGTTGSSAKWQRQQQGLVKINTDAAVFMEGGSTGIGSVMRNEQGEFLRARNQKLQAMYSPREVDVSVLP